MSRPKWWEVATDPDQIELFQVLARHPKYDWRNIEGLLKTLNWTPQKFQKVVTPFLQNRILITKKNKNGVMLGYWERVDNDPCKKGCDDKNDDKRLDPNVI